MWKARCSNPDCRRTVMIDGGMAAGSCPVCGGGLTEFAQITSREWYLSSEEQPENGSPTRYIVGGPMGPDRTP